LGNFVLRRLYVGRDVHPLRRKTDPSTPTKRTGRTNQRCTTRRAKLRRGKKKLGSFARMTRGEERTHLLLKAQKMGTGAPHPNNCRHKVRHEQGFGFFLAITRSLSAAWPGGGCLAPTAHGVGADVQEVAKSVWLALRVRRCGEFLGQICRGRAGMRVIRRLTAWPRYRPRRPEASLMSSKIFSLIFFAISASM